MEREEYGFWSGDAYTEACLKIRYDDTRFLDMICEGWEKASSDDGKETLKIHFTNRGTRLRVCMHYDVYYENDIVSRYVTITNEGKDVVIDSVKSAALTLPPQPAYRLRYVTGKWAGEFQLQDLTLPTGVFTLQSKRGITGPHFNPSFALDDGTATETTGNVWFGLLGYSGNWKIDIEKTIFNNVRIVGGINDFDFSYTLKQGESFTTPQLILGFSNSGYGGMSRTLHAYQLKHIHPRSVISRVLYNSWEATTFDVTLDGQKALAKKAAAMGIELFVVDDGWFGARNSDKAGLGDWHVNRKKFPNGLEELIREVKALGMDFGIWVEPEAVNPDSDLYRAHPDWIYRFEGRQPRKARNQYVLNISRPEVKAYIIQFMTGLLEEHPHITFIKWDMNRAVSDLSAGSTKSDQALWYKHVEALYEIWALLRKRFPHVEFETCAGGGGRIDLGILRYAEECWPSDNTDAYDRLFIQEGFSYFYNPRIMMCWVTDTHPHSNKYLKPIAYKFHSSMMGSLGIGSNISRLSEDEAAEYKRYIEQYKTLRETVQFGSQYRLLSTRESSLSAVEYISRNEREIVVLAFLHGQKNGDECPRIKLQGLSSEAVYRVDGSSLDLSGSTLELNGSTLMHVGLPVKLHGDFDSLLLRLEKL